MRDTDMEGSIVQRPRRTSNISTVLPAAIKALTAGRNQGARARASRSRESLSKAARPTPPPRCAQTQPGLLSDSLIDPAGQ